MNEGVFDVMAAKYALDQEVDLRDVVPVGTFGKNLSDSNNGDDQIGELLRLKRRGLKKVTFMWDGEQKALDAAAKAGQKIVQYGFDVRIATLPKGKDPNEVVPKEVVLAYYGARPLNARSILGLKRHYR